MTAPIALFFGTRPQVIKASVLRDALAATGPVAGFELDLTDIWAGL